VDHLVAFEVIEAARWVHYLRADGRLVVNSRAIQPLPVLTGRLPAPVGLEAALTCEGATFLDADALACEAGSPRSANMVLMGGVSVGLPFSRDVWCDVITARVPAATVEANLRAFDLGRAACEGVCPA
jgi:indolepyruvate ferredoxin oxidoreductase beta subunit